jgi:hypothetical protein
MHHVVVFTTGAMTTYCTWRQKPTSLVQKKNARLNNPYKFKAAHLNKTCLGDCREKLPNNISKATIKSVQIKSNLTQ